jgi:hypothetical protein
MTEGEINLRLQKAKAKYKASEFHSYSFAQYARLLLSAYCCGDLTVDDLLDFAVLVPELSKGLSPLLADNPLYPKLKRAGMLLHDAHLSLPATADVAFSLYPSKPGMLEAEPFGDVIDFAPVRAYFAAHPCRSSAYAPKLNAFVFLTDCSLLIWMLNAKAWSAPIEVPEDASVVRQVGGDVYVLAPNSLSVLAEDGVSWVVNVLTEGRDFKECPSVDQSKCFECQMKHAAANTVKGIFCSAKCEDRYIARGSVFFGNEPSVITSRGPQPDTVILDDIDAGGDPDTVRQTLVNVIAAPIVAKITKAEIAFKCPDCFTASTVDAAYLARLKASENFNSSAKMRVPGCACQVTIKRVAEAIEKVQAEKP